MCIYISLTYRYLKVIMTNYYDQNDKGPSNQTNELAQQRTGFRTHTDTSHRIHLLSLSAPDTYQLLLPTLTHIIGLEQL